jgi:hypothetical protein
MIRTSTLTALMVAFFQLTVEAQADNRQDGSLVLATQPACVQLIADADGEVLLNRCGQCNEITVEHIRPGANFPSSRIILVPARGRAPLPFRGPGRTRITSERPCPASAGQPLGEPAETPLHCIGFTEARPGSPILVNGCSACRSIVVENADPAGNRTRRAFTLQPKSAAAVTVATGSKARIVRDGPCVNTTAPRPRS